MSYFSAPPPLHAHVKTCHVSRLIFSPHLFGSIKIMSNVVSFTPRHTFGILAETWINPEADSRPGNSILPHFDVNRFFLA